MLHSENIETNIQNRKPANMKQVNTENSCSARTSVNSLIAILENVEASQENWPKTALCDIIKRNGRMPRYGWSRTHQMFCEKFKEDISIKEFMKRAKSALITSSGKKCSIRELRRDTTRSEVCPKENTLHEMMVYNEVKKVYARKIAELKTIKIDQADWTRKLPSVKINILKLDSVCKAVEDYTLSSPPQTMTDIARAIQAAQQCYEEVTKINRPPSTWKANIEAKINKWKDQINLLEKSKGLKRIEPKDKETIRRLMEQQQLCLDKKKDYVIALSRLKENITVFNKKLDMSQKRKEYKKQNDFFELFRKQFYRSIHEESTKINNVPIEEIKGFWSTMWNKDSKTTTNKSYENYLCKYYNNIESRCCFPSYEEFQQIVNGLPNWKGAGPDGVYNFFIKKCQSLHRFLYNIIKETCLEGKEQESWFYKGITYLIPKENPKEGSDFRPITCMSNLYKLTTKCVAKVLQLIVEERDLLADNQLGTVRKVQGAKEQALLNIAINKNHNHKLKTTWIDVKKAFDSIDHSYLMECIEKLSLDDWIIRFLRGLLSKWNITLQIGKERIMNKKIERGILQGDSLSPLLFVLCMDPLSRKLNGLYPQISIKTDNGYHTTNHLLFIDDLKLMAQDEVTLVAMLNETKKFFESVGLETNKDKSATNSPTCSEDAKLLDTIQSYKYLGITENSASEVTSESINKIKAEIISRTELLCKTKLNARNLFKAINEHAISVINYYIGVLKLEPEVFSEIDNSIRQVLIDHSIHLQPGCKERLYIPRNMLGRGLQSVEHRSENMLMQLRADLESSKEWSSRRAAILKVEVDNKTHLSLILRYLSIKYSLNEQPTLKTLQEAQLKTLMSDIKRKNCHEKLFRAFNNENISVKNSSEWLKNGNISPKEEASLCYLQDRNVFWDNNDKCPHCKSCKKTVDHLATKCVSMLANDYTLRHNEVLKSIHLLLCNKYGFKNSKKLRVHSAQDILENDWAEIRVDTRINTDIRVKNNKPDIFIHDKKRKEIVIIEIGITNQDLLKTVETEKLRKYDVLANELGLLYKCRTKIIPYVMTWDGMVTNYHKRHIKEIGIPVNVEAYIQSRVLKKTLESISFDSRRNILEDNDIDI